MKKLLFLLGVFSILVFIGTARATTWTCDSCASCENIIKDNMTNGDTLLLNASIDVTGFGYCLSTNSAGFGIPQNDTVIDCQGNTLYGTGSGIRVGNWTQDNPSHNITIQNCIFSIDSGTDIESRNVYDLKILSTNLSNASVLLNLNCGAGISPDKVLIKDVNLISSGSAYGLEMTQYSSCNYTNVELNNVHISGTYNNFGIWLTYIKDSLVINSSVESSFKIENTNNLTITSSIFQESSYITMEDTLINSLFYNNIFNASGHCYGTCTSCSSFSNQTSCNAQDGCNWTSQEAGCYWIDPESSGFPCDTYHSSQIDCLDYPSVCYWTDGGDICTGICTSCSLFSNQTSCDAQSGCSFSDGIFEGVLNSTNSWNTTKTNLTNIIGGLQTGGNFWSLPNGTGYSQVCDNLNNDSFCDVPYTFNPTDFLPLSNNYSEENISELDINWLTPTNNSVVNTNYIYWSVNLSEAPIYCNLSINGSANVTMSIVGTGCSYNSTNLTNATTFCGVVFAADLDEGNVSDMQCASTNFDITSPTITIYSPQNITYNNVSQADLQVSANEIINTWWYKLNGGTNTTFIPNTTINIANGSNILIVYANDTAGNIGFASISFTANYPCVTFLNSPNDGNTTISSVPISMTFNCSALNDINLANITLYLNGVPNETVSITGIYNFSTFTKSLSLGTYNWTCRACDYQDQCSFGVPTRTLSITAPPTPRLIDVLGVFAFPALIVLGAGVILLLFEGLLSSGVDIKRLATVIIGAIIIAALILSLL
jgi:hypothetical protein